MSQETGLELVVTNDVHYITADDAEAHDILLCIQTQKKVSDEDRMRYEGGQFYLKSEEEMRELFAYVPQGNLILSGTIRENIAFASETDNEEKIIKSEVTPFSPKASITPKVF